MYKWQEDVLIHSNNTSLNKETEIRVSTIETTNIGNKNTGNRIKTPTPSTSTNTVIVQNRGIQNRPEGGRNGTN